MGLTAPPPPPRCIRYQLLSHLSLLASEASQMSYDLIISQPVEFLTGDLSHSGTSPPHTLFSKRRGDLSSCSPSLLHFFPRYQILLLSSFLKVTERSVFCVWFPFFSLFFLHCYTLSSLLSSSTSAHSASQLAAGEPRVWPCRLSLHACELCVRCWVPAT